MSGHEGITHVLAEKVLGVETRTIPQPVRDVVSHAVLDGLGVTLAGIREPSGLANLIWQYVRESGASGTASVAGGGFKTDPQGAAFANGTLCHALDFDNTWWPVAHPTSPILPAILAVAEQRGKSGRQVLEALIAGFEVHGRLRMATEASPFGVGFHRNGVAGIMGAVAGVGRLIELPVDSLTAAFGIAGSRAGSMAANTGTMTKPASAGHAARMGVESARLAELGWTAHPDIFGTGGYLDLFFGEGLNDPELLVADFGDPFRLESPGIGFKKYPCNYFTHRAIDATLEAIAGTGPVTEPQVEAIRITGPPFGYIDRPSPASGLDAKFSVQFVTVIAALDGEVKLGSFSDAQLRRAEVQRLLERTTYLQGEDIPLDFRFTWSSVEIDTGGGTLAARCDRPRGMWGYPLSRSERLEKVRDCVGLDYPETQLVELIALTEGMDALERLDDLMTLVRESRIPRP